MRFSLREKALTAALIVIFSLTAVGCDDAPTPGTTASVASVTPSHCPSTGTPSINISPRHGKAGTVVTVVGGGFPAGCSVEIRLSSESSSSTPQIYAQAEAAQSGYVQASFRMPDRWPNGEAIVIPTVLVVAATPDFAEKAYAPFAFEAFGTPQSTPTSGQISHLSSLPASDLVAYPTCDDLDNPYFEANKSKFSN